MKHTLPATDANSNDHTETDSLTQQMRLFLADAWPAKLQGQEPQGIDPIRGPSAAQQAWFTALAKQGWVVPRWPATQGGCHWTVRQHHTWQRLSAQCQAPLSDWIGVDLIGPLLLDQFSDKKAANESEGRAIENHLQAIRQARVRWGLALSRPAFESIIEANPEANPETGAEFPVHATSGIDKPDVLLPLESLPLHCFELARSAVGGGGGSGRNLGKLSGECRLYQAGRADYLLGLFRSQDESDVGYALISLQQPGVDLARAASGEITSVCLRGVAVQSDTQTDGGGQRELAGITLVPVSGTSVSQLRHLITMGLFAVEALPVARLSNQLASLDQVGQRLFALGDQIWQTPSMVRQHAELAVDLDGLLAIEERLLALAEGAGSGAGETLSRQLRDTLDIGLARVESQIEEVRHVLFGYYALPQPDGLRGDNEPDHEIIELARRARLNAGGRSSLMAFEYQQRDRIAASLKLFEADEGR